MVYLFSFLLIAATAHQARARNHFAALFLAAARRSSHATISPSTATKRGGPRGQRGEAAGGYGRTSATSRVLDPLQCPVLGLGEGDETALQSKQQTD
jgi:hypothetical protein